METFIHMNSIKLTKQERVESLLPLLLLLEKRDGKVKLRGWVYGQKQREKINKEDPEYPTVSL